MAETFKKNAIELSFVTGVSLAVGLCAGLVQGWIAFGGGESSEDRLGMSVLASGLGALVAVVLGPLLYYVLLRKRLTWRLGFSGILLCILAGASIAGSLTVFTKFGGWLSMFATPMVAILFSIFVRLTCTISPRTELSRAKIS